MNRIFRIAVIPALVAAMATPALHAGEPAADGAPLFDTGGFVFARWASASSSVLYAGQGWGRAGVFFGALQNPDSGYRELIAGAMTRLVRDDLALLVGLAFAEVTEGDYLQLYLAPSFARGGWSADATVEWYEPLESASYRQLGVNPLMVLRRIDPRWQVGVSSVGAVGDGDPPSLRAGAVIERSLPKGLLQLELLAGFAHAEDEVRLGFKASF
jgi:hypothetical protein